jgi:hypothetical protein
MKGEGILPSEKRKARQTRLVFETWQVLNNKK